MAFDQNSPEYASLSAAQRIQLQKCGRLDEKQKRIVRRRNSFKVPDPEIVLEPEGTILAMFEVPGRAIPWQTHGHPRPILRKWQRTVAKGALVGFHRGQRPYQGSIALEIGINFCKSIKKHPDLTNCIKAIEDAMQGVIFVNDRQVRRTVAWLDFSEIARHEQCVEVEVLAWSDR